jgi:nicotinamidase-related amidase
MFHVSQMSAGDSGLLVVDVQDKLVPHVVGYDRLLGNLAFLLDAAHLLGVFIQATEQYPRGLGRTVPELASRLPQRLEKLSFSCCAVPAIIENFRSAARSKIVVTGIETHVCVLHTALDLLAHDFRAYIVVDAVSSRSLLDHDVALRRLERAGAILVTAETVVFEWTAGADHPRFKDVSALVKARMTRNNAGTRTPPIPSA